MSVFLAYLFFMLSLAAAFVWYFDRRKELSLSLPSLLSISINTNVFSIILFYFLIRFISIQPLVPLFWFIPVVTLVFFVIKNKNDIRKFLHSIFQSINANRKKIIIFSVLLIIFFLIISFYLFQNGFDAQGNLKLHGLFATEVIFHLSIVSQLDYNIFPQTLQIISNSYHHYHFFADLFIHFFSALSNVDNNFQLYLYFFVPVMVFTLGINVFSLAYDLFNDFQIAVIALFLSLFCYDLSSFVFWIKAILLEGHFWFGSHQHSILSFWTPLANQFQLFHNPPFLMSSVLFLGMLQITLWYFRKPGRLWMWLCALGWVLLIKIKITVFFLGVTGIIAYSIIIAINKKNYSGLKLFLLIIACAIPLLLMTVGQNSNKVVFSNWFFLSNFALRNHFISREEFNFIRDHSYINSPKTMLMFVMSSCLFFAGLLSFRLLPMFKKDIVKKVLILFHSSHISVLFLTIIIAGLISFQFFSAKIAPHDTMWFYLGIIFILNIYAAKKLHEIIFLKNTFLNIAIKSSVIVILIFSILTFLLPVFSRNQENAYIIPSVKIKAFEVIKKSPVRKRILSRHYDMKENQDEKNFLLTAFTGKPVVVEGLDYTVNFRTRNPEFMKQITMIRNDIEYFFYTSYADSAKKITDKYDVGFVYLEPTDTIRSEYRELTKYIFNLNGYSVLEIKE